MAKKKISNFWAFTLGIALRGLKVFIARINHEPSRKILEGMRKAFERMVDALSDSNPDDDKQIQAIVHDTLTTGDFYQGSRSTIVANIGRINNPNIQTVLLNLVDPVYEIGSLMTDEDKDNEAQVKELLTRIAVDEKGLESIVALLGLVFDDEAAAFIGAVIASYLERLVNDNPAEAERLDISKAHVIAIKEKYAAIAEQAA